MGRGDDAIQVAPPSAVRYTSVPAFGLYVGKKARVASATARPRLHIGSAMPVAVTRCHVAAPSAVFPIDAVWVWQSGMGLPVVSSRPFRSSPNDISVLTRVGGVDRSTQVSPRSDDRKSRVPPTNAQTTPPDDALSWAVVGSDIGAGDGVGELVAVRVGVGEDVGVTVGEDTAFGWFEHATSRTATRTNPRTHQESHDLGKEPLQTSLTDSACCEEARSRSRTAAIARGGVTWHRYWLARKKAFVRSAHNSPELYSSQVTTGTRKRAGFTTDLLTNDQRSSLGAAGRRTSLTH